VRWFFAYIWDRREYLLFSDHSYMKMIWYQRISETSVVKCGRSRRGAAKNKEPRHNATESRICGKRVSRPRNGGAGRTQSGRYSLKTNFQGQNRINGGQNSWICRRNRSEVGTASSFLTIKRRRNERRMRIEKKWNADLAGCGCGKQKLGLNVISFFYSRVWIGLRPTDLTDWVFSFSTFFFSFFHCFVL